MNHAWILGSGGLLGSSVKEILRQQKQCVCFDAPHFDWGHPENIGRQLRGAVDLFAAHIGSEDTWELHWMAGRSTMNSERRDLEDETRTLATILALWHAHPVLGSAPGTIVFASSAGGIYAGSTDETITESSDVSPLSAYGEEKLAQERMIEAWTERHHGRSALIARLSTLYGPKQSHGKKQGLLTHIARCMLQRTPIDIFVPLDTIRDYVHVRDAAEEIVRSAERVRSKGRTITKIIAAEEPTTIAQIIALFQHVTRRAPRLIASTGERSKLYTRRICFRSTILTDARTTRRTSLLCGIAEIIAQERLAMACGQAPASR